MTQAADCGQDSDGVSNRRSALYTLCLFEAFTHREACHWIRGSLLSPMNPVPLPPQGETRSMERKNRGSYISCTIPQFPPLVVNAVSQSPACLSCHMTQKANPVTLTLYSSPVRAIPQPSGPKAPSNLRTLRPIGPVHLKHLFLQPLLHNLPRQRRPFY